MINKSTVVGQKYILLKSSLPNHGFDLTSTDDYAIQSPNGLNKEIFNIERINGDTIFLKVPLHFPHPKTRDITTYHIIV